MGRIPWSAVRVNLALQEVATEAILVQLASDLRSFSQTLTSEDAVSSLSMIERVERLCETHLELQNLKR